MGVVQEKQRAKKSGEENDASYRQSFYTVFFFQAKDGVRGAHVTGVQTCALPIWFPGGSWGVPGGSFGSPLWIPWGPWGSLGGPVGVLWEPGSILVDLGVVLGGTLGSKIDVFGIIFF